MELRQIGGRIIEKIERDPNLTVKQVLDVTFFFISPWLAVGISLFPKAECSWVSISGAGSGPQLGCQAGFIFGCPVFDAWPSLWAPPLGQLSSAGRLGGPGRVRVQRRADHHAPALAGAPLVPAQRGWKVMWLRGGLV